MGEAAARRQMALFGAEPRPLPREETEGPDLGHVRLAPEPLPGQIDLFAERARLARDLDAALREGDLPEARRLRLCFEETYGRSPEVDALRSLDSLADSLAAPHAREVLVLWRGLDASLEAHPRLRRLIQVGVFGRLLRLEPADDIASTSPETLPALASFLAVGAGSSPDEGIREARRLVRDALISGRHLEALDFRWDEALADLLAGDDTPAWLACLGVVQRLWPAPRPSPEDSAALAGSLVEPDSPDVAARAFWSCLLVAEDRDCREADLHEARRRMKRLRPDLHAQYMRRTPARTGRG